MNNLKYPEKKYLLEYDLSLNLFNEMGIEVIDVIPLRKVFILHTKDGKKIFKRVEASEERIEFINMFINSIYDKGGNVTPFKVFSDGKCYKNWNGGKYIVMDLIQGREMTFTNPIEFKGAASLLARIHLAGREVLNSKVKDGELIKNLMDRNLIIKFEESIEDLIEIKKMVNGYKYKNDFDKMFIESSTETILEMKKAKELLELSEYYIDIEKMEDIVICHNDLAEHNFIINEEEITLIDFDYLTIDLRVMDVADLILKGIKNVAFDLEKGIDIIQEYSKVYPLKENDYKYIYYLLLFPRDYYIIVKNYYHKEKSWNEDVYINRLKNKINNDKFRRDFLNDFIKKLKMR
jgi:CotS family spore coat protein